MTGIKCYNRVMGFRILKNLSRVLVGITDCTRRLNRDADAAAKRHIIVVLQSSTDIVQNLRQIFYIIIGTYGIRKAENQCKMAQIQG